ncbi:hypothetical protein FPZ12_032410 [Amycolatopsis acidicola]|uniref:DUF4149 domain-containing protein n=1 Tax=Amycolatopsis acidicola TaxID=2596893 RepID=A0A5N0US42_9PSEU|nr:hypothetical protein [Amycolatopsis acidicola]KAA9154310.1 hypothetical protein FPZ12_032410 [Amycolatopsis acidicola]
MNHAAGALTFLWLGMVLAISFLEAPLKFRAPDVTIPIGLGIGRLVFRALNLAEAALGVAVLVLAIGGGSGAVLGFATGALVVLLAQVALIRPTLNRRSDRVLAGEDLPRSPAHFCYVGAEGVKVLVLLGLGISALV